jgi:signal transduction histidine kinase
VALRQLTLTEEQLKGLLALGRCERPPSGPCDVGRLLDEVALLVGPACEHARVALRTNPHEAAMTVTADADGLRAAVLNLTLNAVEAAGPGGHVELDASASNGSVYVEVADDGPGPPPELAETLFDPFVTAKPSGVGLGLALAKSVSLDHGGELSWDRDVDRKMTRFRLRLPRNGTAGDPQGGAPG